MYTKPVYCKSVLKTSLLCKYTQSVTKSVSLQQYTKPVLLYKCLQNQFTVQVYTKLVYWLIMKGMYMDRTILRNVQGWNITKIRAVQTMCKMCNVCKICTKFTVHVYKKPVYHTSVQKNSLLYKCN